MSQPVSAQAISDYAAIALGRNVHQMSATEVDDVRRLIWRITDYGALTGCPEVKSGGLVYDLRGATVVAVRCPSSARRIA